MFIDIQEQEVILAHLGQIRETAHYKIFSGFIAALRDARKFTKRDQATGEKLRDDTCGDHGSWLGAIGYLTLLDQIGGCFKPKSFQIVNGHPIVKALRYFGGLSFLQADAVYALRCSLAHDFGTVNVHPSKPSLTHIFTLYQSPNSPLITFPKNQWDGDLTNISPDSATMVNLEKLGDLVEGIYETLQKLAAKSELEIVLPGGFKELAVKYTFWTPKKS